MFMCIDLFDCFVINFGKRQNVIGFIRETKICLDLSALKLTFQEFDECNAMGEYSILALCILIKFELGILIDLGLP